MERFFRSVHLPLPCVKGSIPRADSSSIGHIRKLLQISVAVALLVLWLYSASPPKYIAGLIALPSPGDLLRVHHPSDAWFSGCFPAEEEYVRIRQNASRALSNSALPRCRGCAAPSILPLVATGLELGGTNATIALESAACPGHLHVYSAAEGSACLRGRRVFVFGNSLARGLAASGVFAFMNVPPPGILSREVQKAECKKTPLESHQSSCSFADDAWSLDFYWTQYFDFDTGGGSNVPPSMLARFQARDDACVPAFTSTRECLRVVLGPSRPGDILIFAFGLHYSSEPELNNAEQWYDAMRWANTSAAHFVEHIAASWHGRPEDVFRVRVSPFSPNIGDNDRNWTDMVNAGIASVNAGADAAFTGTGWSTLDMASLASAYVSQYVDLMHFTNEFSVTLWHVLLSSLCGDPAAWH
jgi:hypothetical protein